MLHKWATNCGELRGFANTQSRPSNVKNRKDKTYVKTELGTNEIYRKILGINWDLTV